MYVFFNDSRYDNQKSYFSSILCILIGILLVVIPYETLKDIIFTILGIGIILINIIPCIIYWDQFLKNKSYLPQAIMTTISVVIGFIFIFYNHWIIGIILGLWLIFLPVLRIIKSNDRLSQFKKEIPLFILAIFLFFVPVEGILNIAIKVFGGLLIAYGIINCILITIHNNKNNDDDNDNQNNQNTKNDDRVIIDMDVKDIK
ncbi:TPA: hypothetical protein IAA91_02640 [Candidatus Avacholeplasma faecigallinarum]|nr:hypothetical protein [Candidatus Avacholeplasma faecigallinarum]